MTLKVNTLDIAKYLETEEDIVDFLNEVSKIGNSSDIVHALGIAARARGMTEMAREIGVTRTSLYKSLSHKGNPNFDTIVRVSQALGLQLNFSIAN